MQRVFYGAQSLLTKGKDKFMTYTLAVLQPFGPAYMYTLLPGAGASSVLGLAFCSAGLAGQIEWLVLDLHDSDRYPVHFRKYDMKLSRRVSAVNFSRSTSRVRGLKV
jgi:hypothetical protein